jgi:hypothetical protein
MIEWLSALSAYPYMDIPTPDSAVARREHQSNTSGKMGARGAVKGCSFDALITVGLASFQCFLNI